MTLLQGFLLGLVQGLTEFLPVSSSGHLVIGQHLLGLTEAPVFFDVTVHSATALAVIVLTRERLRRLSFKELKLLFLGSIPAGVVGVWLNQDVEKLFNSLNMVGIALVVTAAILWLTKLVKNKKTKKSLGLKETIWVGLFQSVAIIPGISRSGSTISAGLFAGLTPKAAFEFSFLLSLPAILGAQVLQLIKLENIAFSEISVLGVGFISAFVTGLLALKLLKQVVVKQQIHWFAIYCFIVGLSILIFY
jgi:undecaprenyl-diphosphatase